jgi:dipeptidase
MIHDTNEIIRFPSGVEITQVEETLAYVAIAQFNEGESIELIQGGINEYQVSVGSSSGDHILKDKVRILSPRHPTAIGDYRMTIALQKAETAREAIEIMGDLTDRYGARTDNYIVADPNEAWLWEEMQDKRWMAMRIPDDCFVVEANNRRMGEVDVNSLDYMGSNDIISFAIEHGLYDLDSGEEFHCAKAYSYRGEIRDKIPSPKYNSRRIWRGISLLAPSTNLDLEADYFPLFIKPDHRLTPKDLLNVLKDHYEGTKYDLYKAEQKQYRYSGMYLNNLKEYQLSPSWHSERIIGTAISITNWIAQLRGWLPNPIGGILWGGLAAAWATPHILFYLGITKTPEPFNIGTNIRGTSSYNPKSAYWIFETITSLVNLFYRPTINMVQPVWENWEDRLYALQPSLEKVVLDLYKADNNLAIGFLTDYSCSKAMEALDIAKKMIPKIITKIASSPPSGGAQKQPPRET